MTCNIAIENSILSVDRNFRPTLIIPNSIEKNTDIAKHNVLPCCSNMLRDYPALYKSTLSDSTDVLLLPSYLPGTPLQRTLVEAAVTAGAQPTLSGITNCKYDIKP
jgi:hypothetical protein